MPPKAAPKPSARKSIALASKQPRNALAASKAKKVAANKVKKATARKIVTSSTTPKKNLGSKAKRASANASTNPYTRREAPKTKRR